MQTQNHARDEDLIDWIHLNCFEKKVFNDIRGWVTTTINNSIRARPNEDPGVMYMLIPADIKFKDNPTEPVPGYQFLMSIRYSETDAEQYEAFLPVNKAGMILSCRDKDDVFVWNPVEDAPNEGR